MENNGDDQDAEVKELVDGAKELRSYIIAVDKKIKDLVILKDKDTIYEFEVEDSVVYGIEKLYRDQELVKRDFFELLKKFFMPIQGGGDLKLSQENRTQVGLIKCLKAKVEEFKKDEDVVNENSNNLLSKLYADCRAIRREDEVLSSTCGVWRLSEENNENSMLLSKKLNMIQYYYLPQIVDHSSQMSSSRSRFHREFRWLRNVDCDHQFEDGNVSGPKLEARNKSEVKEKIWRLVHERSEEMAKAQREGKMSLMERMVSDKAAKERKAIHAKANELGILISRHVSDLFFIVAQRGETFHKLSDHLICIIKWLAEREKGIVMKRLVSVLEVAERDLLIKRKIGIYGEMSAIQGRSARRQLEAIDQILEMLLREVLRLESILSYPILREDEGLEVFEIALEECDKEVKKIGLEMANLMTIHSFISEDEKENLLMDAYHVTVECTISVTWGNLDEECEPN